MFYLVTKIIRRREKIEYFYLFITSKGLVGGFSVLRLFTSADVSSLYTTGFGIQGVGMECALGRIGCGREYSGEGGK